MFYTRGEIVVGRIIGGLIAAPFLFILYVVFVVLPVGLRTEELCYAKGFPEATVTWNLKRYCMNLSGDVTVNIAELK